MRRLTEKEVNEIRYNKDAIFRGKNFEYNEVLVKIRKYKNDFFKIFVVLLVIILFIVSIFLIRRTDYFKKLKSTTWYEEVSYLESSHPYTETDDFLDGTKSEITKYKRFYIYTGKDNVEYWYSQTGYDEIGEVGEELKILVDEKDNSKSLEIKSFKNENIGLIILSSILLGPFVIAYLFIIIRLYLKKIKLDIQNKKVN